MATPTASPASSPSRYAPQQATPTHIYKLTTPTTQKIQFDAVFRNVEPETEEMLKKVSYVRDEVVVALERASSDAAIKAIDRYFPLLVGLIQAASALPPDSTKSLKVAWTLPLNGKYFTSHMIVYGSLNFEYVMLLMAYGVLHRNAAHELLNATSDSSYDANSKIMSSLLCRSAGIFEYIRGELLKWVPKPDGVFAEFVDETYVALSNLSLAEAQQLAIKKALMAGSASSSVVAKLCADVANKCDHCAMIVRGFGEQVTQQFEAYLTLSGSLFKALAAKFVALDCGKSVKFGQAIGYLNSGLSFISPDLKPNRYMPTLDSFINTILSQRKEMAELCAIYIADNNAIYFDRVLSATDAQQPEGKCITKPQPYAPPEPHSVQIVVKEGGLCILQ
jgi:hypothetical protein